MTNATFNAKELSLDNMKNSYLANYADMENTWKAFFRMYKMGFIASETWKQFNEETKFWVYNRLDECVVDELTEKVIMWV